MLSILSQLIKLYGLLECECDDTHSILGSVQTVHVCELFCQGALVASDPVPSSISPSLYGALVKP